VTANGEEKLSFNGLAVLYRVARALAAGGLLEINLENVLEALEVYAGMNRGTITILKPGNVELAVGVSRGLSAQERQRGT